MLSEMLVRKDVSRVQCEIRRRVLRGNIVLPTFGEMVHDTVVARTLLVYVLSSLLPKNHLIKKTIKVKACCP